MTFAEFIETYASRLDDEGGWIKFSDRGNHPGPPKKAADSFVQSLGLKTLGERWFDLQWDVPKYSSEWRFDRSYHLAKVLERNPVHSFYVWFGEKDAQQLADDFYGLFDRNKLVRLSNRIANGWNPITNSTFEAVHIAIDDALIGMICVEAED